MEKRIGIITITNDDYNFGNRLQNYALQTVLERMGYDVETLNRPIRGNQRVWWKKAKDVLHYIIPYHRQIKHLKAGNFFFWNRRYIKWSKDVITDEVLPSLANKYDYFIAGSDQIWNPKFLWGTDPYMFLQFALPEQRIAYASSLGVDTLNECDVSSYKQLWTNWKALSAREFEGAKIIGDIINKQIPTLIDPTLLLSREEWESLTRKIKTPQKYVFVYMLGEITGRYKEYLSEVCCKGGYEMVDVMNDIRYAGCSPSAFVALIQHASIVVADSYHAMVFALIFHKPFTFIDRVGWGMNMNSRVNTLVKMFDLPVPKLEAITEFNIDWSLFEQKLASERKRAKEYLLNALR